MDEITINVIENVDAIQIIVEPIGVPGRQGDKGDEGDKGDKGDDAPFPIFQYSGDKILWHGDPLLTDIYMRESSDGGTIWSPPIEFKGPPGTTLHNAMSDLQGGSVLLDQFFHLTQTEHGYVENLISDPQTQINGKESANTNIQAHISSSSNPHNTTKEQVGLGNVDNTADADKPIGTAAAAALAEKADLVDGYLDPAQLPPIAITDTFVVANQAQMLALVCEKGDVAVRSDLMCTFILQNGSPSVLANWVQLPTPTDHVLSVAGKSGIVTLLKADVGLSNVDNTPDVSKPVSTAAQTALNTKQDSLGYTPENTGNKSTDSSFSANSDTLYPSQKAVKTALTSKEDDLGNPVVDGQIISSTVSGTRQWVTPTPVTEFVSPSLSLYTSGSPADIFAFNVGNGSKKYIPESIIFVSEFGVVNQDVTSYILDFGTNTSASYDGTDAVLGTAQNILRIGGNQLMLNNLVKTVGPYGFTFTGVGCYDSGAGAGKSGLTGDYCYVKGGGVPNTSAPWTLTGLTKGVTVQIFVIGTAARFAISASNNGVTKSLLDVSNNTAWTELGTLTIDATGTITGDFSSVNGTTEADITGMKLIITAPATTFEIRDGANGSGNIIASGIITGLTAVNTVQSVNITKLRSTAATLYLRQTSASKNAASVSVAIELEILSQTSLPTTTGYITLTTTGNSGAASLIADVLNIPTPTLAALGGVTLDAIHASSPLVYNQGTGTMGIQRASGAQSGYIHADDFTTFENKQNALGFTPVPVTRTINAQPLSANIVISKADLGLSNVDNTADVDKAISTATQSALNDKSSLQQAYALAILFGGS